MEGSVIVKVDVDKEYGRFIG